MASRYWKSARIIKKNAHVDRIFIKEETKAHIKKVSAILKKPEGSRTEEEWNLLQQSEDVIELIRKRTQIKEQTRQRHQEVEDSTDLLQKKCEELASVIRNAKSLVIYTGAGISTAASIPDYRGPNGVWTLLKQGKQLRSLDLCDADPTLTHMAIVELYQHGYVKRVVSQNCDGLHVRSGLPRSALSELHGNMYLETCRSCQPQVEYIRLFDVTERTAMRRHKTGRRCYKCSSPLFDTIVHFGEKGGHEAPYNWSQAVDAADSADVILCLGSSLKVLKKYACLWGMHKPFAKRPHLYIVNLQWTPKDPVAALKINGRCDEVMLQVMKNLQIDIHPYSRNTDPIFTLASRLSSSEFKTTTKKILTYPGFIASNGSQDTKSARGKRFMKKQTVQSLPTRVMPPRRVKAPTRGQVLIKHPGHDWRKGCVSQSLHSADHDRKTLAKEAFKSNDGPKAEFSEPSRKRFCDCISTIDTLARQFGHASESLGQVVKPENLSGGADGDMVQRLYSDGRNADEKLSLCGMGANVNCWWNSVDSKTWLEALQAYLMHLSGQNVKHDEDADLRSSSSSGNHFTNLCQLNSSNPVCLSCGNAPLHSKICGRPRPSDEQSSSDHSDEIPSEKFSEGSSFHHQLKTRSAQTPDGGFSLLSASGSGDDKELFSQLSHRGSVCDSSFSHELSGTLSMCDKIQRDRMQNDRTASEMEVEKRKFCTLSDLKMMHDVLFDPKDRRFPISSSNHSVPSTSRSVLDVCDSDPAQFNFTDICNNQPSIEQPWGTEGVMASVDLVRFMHSYCQQGKTVKDEALFPAEATSVSTTSNRTVPSSFLDFLHDRMQLRNLLGPNLGHGDPTQKNINTTMEMMFRSCAVDSERFPSNSAVLPHAVLCKTHPLSDGLTSNVDIGKPCLAEFPETQYCSSSNVTHPDVPVKKAHCSVSVPGWFGKGISVRKLKRKHVK